MKAPTDEEQNANIYYPEVYDGPKAIKAKGPKYRLVPPHFINEAGKRIAKRWIAKYKASKNESTN